MLGSTLTPTLLKMGLLVQTHSRGTEADFSFDLLNQRELFASLDEIEPNVIINLVGLTSVELCQEQPSLAYQINTKSVENIVEWIEAGNRSCYLIQISTDQVYDGAGPHLESSVSITNNYAFSKYSGELAAKRVASAILRTNFVGLSKSIGRESLTDWVFRSLRNKSNIEVLDDVFFNPLSMNTLSRLIGNIVETKPIGVFNIGSKDGMSKADFDILFANQLGLSTHLMRRISVREASFLRAYRPRDMRTNVSKFEKFYGYPMPELHVEMDLIVREYNEAF